MDNRRQAVVYLLVVAIAILAWLLLSGRQTRVPDPGREGTGLELPITEPPTPPRNVDRSEF